MQRNSLVRRGATVVITAIIVNVAMLATALVIFGAGGFDPFSVAPVAIATGVGAVGGVVVYAGCQRLFGAAADRWFMVIAVVAAVLSLITLQQAATFPGATTPRLAVLGLMHLLTAAVVIGGLVDWEHV
ncbi:DUF6069 family protein [Natronocalculus amylovorans]|uniref:DUF6069 family protein n=1 Tax=Natronocalculus amylovorans TaxID=2917812 RepID=A0AAE3K944_9EURY|nr:DUF6069 family protein [Natronocalculus amylovorans]MCL9817691.1 DUF6069 family protein [Natronocalculus amylovorans]